jgi:hypothetical protein
MTKLTIGNRRITVGDAKSWVNKYTSTPSNPKKPFGYPSYDTYDTGGSDLLVDGDLLAPVLLNVRLSIAAYTSLQAMAPHLDAQLGQIDTNASIIDDHPLEIIGHLYEPLDQPVRPHGVKGTTLSKVLHRKRPGFIPLFDREIRKCFSEKHKSGPARIPYDRHRTWSTYMSLLAAEIRNDLLAAPEHWEDVRSANGGDYPITLLRCFDIVAWRCGQGNSV